MARSGEWKLAPAYDLTFSPGPGGEHSTSVFGRGQQIPYENLLALGKSADLTKVESALVIEHTTTVVAEWDRFARDCGVGKASHARIGAALSSVRESST